MRIVIFGPPGAGKGTQGVRLAEALKLTHIATGDMLRAEVAAGSDLGTLAKQYMDRGDLVPDDVIIRMIRSHLTDGDGMILDGFPRTIGQAHALDEALKQADMPLDSAIYFNVDRDELVKRLLKRATELGRSDDTTDTINHRMDVYEKQTAPVLDYYSAAGMVTEVDGTGTPDQVFERLLNAVDAGS